MHENQARAVPSSLGANSAPRETFEVLRRAGLQWDRSRLGPTRSLTDIALLAWKQSGNTSTLDARGVPPLQQELLRLTWWSLYACRPHAYASLGLLAAEAVAPHSVLQRAPSGFAANASMAELARLLATSEATRCALGMQGVAETEQVAIDDADRGDADDSYFMNSTCRRFVVVLVSEPPPSRGWCHFHQEVRGLYRLGDVVERPKHQFKGAGSQVMREFNSSIAADYLRTERHGVNNIALLRAILKRRFAREQPLEAAVHIRAGDTIDAPGTSAVQFLCDRNAVGIHTLNPPLLGSYVKPLCYYETVADELHRLGVRTVTLIAGNHNPAGAEPRKSCTYIHAVGALFAKRAQVVYKLNLTADESFAAAARARFFVPSGGGYSALIMKMVRAEGNTVVRGTCKTFAEDFAMLPTAPVGVTQSPAGWLVPTTRK